MFIGDKEVKSKIGTDEITEGGIHIFEVEYTDGKKERFSELMYDAIVSETSIDATNLRIKRIAPVVEATIALLRDWGIKTGELPYLSALLNQSLDYNRNEALKVLFSSWMPTPLDQDEVDLVTIDRILKSKRKTLDDVL